MIAFWFSILNLLFLLFFYYGTGRNKNVLIYSTHWILIISSLALTDFFQNTTSIPPRFLIVLVGNLTFIIYFFKLLKTGGIANRFALGIHTLRLPVELTLYALYIANLVPEIMTFKGWNYDIIIGITALILYAARYIFRLELPGKMLITWNIVGLLFLTIIVTIAILASPLPIQILSFDQPNVAVLKFPYILLPSFIVPVVLLSHILELKQLISHQ